MRVPAFRRGLSADDLALSEIKQRKFLEELASRITRNRPVMWDVPYVWERLLRAAGITQQRPGGLIGPRPPCSLKIEYIYDAEEIRVMRDATITDAREGRPDQPNSAEIASEEQAMSWVVRYCGHDALAAAAVTYGARWAALDLDIVKMIDFAWVGDAQSFDRKKRDGLEAIARGLNRDRVAVT